MSTSVGTNSSSTVNEQTCEYCYIDLDINNHRKKLGLAAAFVHGTDTRYGFSSKDILKLGGSEIKRIKELIIDDHDFADKCSNNNNDGDDVNIEVKPPSNSSGNRIVVRLYWDVAPMACENFATLCTNGRQIITTTTAATSTSDEKNRKQLNSTTSSTTIPVGESGKPLTYKSSKIHRVVPKFILQGGDFVFGNGSGGESIYNGGKKFKDERKGLLLKHNKKGLLSMGNSGKNSNTSQFFFTLSANGASPKCDGKHVVFGEVISGFDVLDLAETYGNSNSNGEPAVPITITDCGQYVPFMTPSAGYHYDKPDVESYTGISSIFVIRPRVGLVVPNKTVLDKFKQCLQERVVITPIIVSNSNNDEQDDGGGNIHSATEMTVRTKIMDLLSTFAIDIILVAPACSDIVCNKNSITELPTSWSSRCSTRILLHEVIMQSKPVDALRTIHTKSWFVHSSKDLGWQLDGLTV